MFVPSVDSHPIWQQRDRTSSALNRKPSEAGGTSSERTARIVALLLWLHPVKTAEHVAANTGLSIDTFSKWQSGVANPGGASLSMLFWVYELPMLVAWLGRTPEWLDPACLAANAERRSQELRLLRARLDALEEDERIPIDGGSRR